MNNSVLKKTRFKRQQWNIGDYFLIPLLDGDFGIAQIIGPMYQEYPKDTQRIIYFDAKVPSEQAAVEAVKNFTLANVVGRTYMIVGFIGVSDPNPRKMFKIFYHSEPPAADLFFDLKEFNRRDGVGIKEYTNGYITEFMDAFHGLSPWDSDYKAGFFDDFLVSPDKKPKHLILNRKQQLWQAGDCFLVPLVDGSYGIGQVIAFEHVQPPTRKDPSWVNTDYISCICFDAKVQSCAAALKLITKLTKKNIIGATLDDRCRLDWIEPGYWEVFYHTKPLWTNLKFENFNRHLAGVEKFLNAFYALTFWDSDYGRYRGDWENKIECVLISEDKKPKNLKYLCKKPPAPKIVPKRPKWLVELDKERRLKK